MDNYCRTCMRDSSQFSQIFEEMTYGGIALQEAIEDICQFEVSNGDELPAYVCRDCALILYDIIKFKMDACDVDRTLRRLRVNNPRIKVENEETREEECVSGTPNCLPCDSWSNTEAGSTNHDPCEDVYVENISREMESFEEEMPRLKSENSDSEEEIVERVSDAPGCSSEDIRTHSGAECCTESCNDQSELNINIPKNSRGKRSVVRRKVEVMDGHGKQNEHSSKDTVDNSVLDDKLHNNLNGNNKESKINMSDGYKLLRKQRVRENRDLEESFPNSHKDKLDQDVTKKKVICTNGSPGNSKKRESAKETISETDLIKSKERMILKKKSVEIKSPLITNSKERSLVERFYCDICKKGFKYKQSLGNHVRVHNGVRPFKCSICSRSFKSNANLRAHNIVHSYGGPHACDQCDKSFKEEYYLKKHIEIHKGKYTCKVCSKVLASRNGFVYHMKLHGNYNHNNKMKSVKKKSPLIRNSKERSLVKRFYCDICKKGFKYKNSLGCHVRVHNGVRPFKCSICSRSFKSNANLRTHNIVHSYGGPHACDQCDKSFKEEFYLKKHIEIHKRKNICKVCSKVLASKSGLHKHMKLHGNYSNFPCIVCGRNFQCELDFNQHLQSHGREYPFTCKICGKGTSSKVTLKQHQLTHNDKKPFSCNLCGKTFKFKYSLKLHSESHEGLKHKCSVCGKDYSTMTYLNVHMKTHSKLQTYSCPNCCKTFTHLWSLKVHLKFTCKA